MPVLDSQFVGLLRCPLTRLPLEEASLDRLASLGLPQEQCFGWDAGLLRSDGRGVYPLRKGIPVLLAEEMLAVAACNGGRTFSPPAVPPA
jgi:uncharacterized protein YbaR (Trm112 family)